METKAKQILKRQKTKVGTWDKRIKWVDPTTITDAEQAVIYRMLYGEHRDRLKRQVEATKLWRLQNKEKRKAQQKRYYQKNKHKLNAYQRKWSKLS